MLQLLSVDIYAQAPLKILYVKKIACLVKLRLSEYKNAIQSYKPGFPFAVHFADMSHAITCNNLPCFVCVCQVLREKYWTNFPSTFENLISKGLNN